ncbi:hypothetical protein EDD16DRAFT_1529239 [Pisolithus croceorrhizus]|nr:hypothetical protein EDD16DRAFT_1529239 [Pisolithus croceorrhizus]KAI6116831.1 hypothetical protein EV401DRAFT_2183599 [Pisolithus croceorrhizus]
MRVTSRTSSAPRSLIFRSWIQSTGQMFKSARWVFDQDREMGLQSFMPEDVDLPRFQVVEHLEKIDPQIFACYNEYLNEEKREGGMFHDRLAESYLTIAVSVKIRGDNRRVLFPSKLTGGHVVMSQRNGTSFDFQKVG